jgi:hypothetical protein
MKTIIKFAPLLLLFFFCQCSEKELEFKPARGIVKFVVDNEIHYFTHIGIGYLNANGFDIMSDTLPTSHKSFRITLSHYIPLDSIKAGHQYPLSYIGRFSTGASFSRNINEDWWAMNDYLTNDLSGSIEVLAWDGKTMEAKIDYWAVNIHKWDDKNRETANYREKHVTGYFKVRVR